MFMNSKEPYHILAAILILTMVIGFGDAINQQWSELAKAFFFAVVIITVVIVTRKLVASMLDVAIEHKVWSVSRWGFASHRILKPEVPAGIVVPMIFTLFSLGYLKIMPLLSYDTAGLKTRAARRFGFASFITLTEWHIAVIGGAGIIGVLLVSFVSYFVGLEHLAKIASYYALINLIPYSNLDGTQILFGSRPLWATLVVVSLLFTAYSLLLV